ncbi:MAG TPA: NUDIX hydrolase, partial [Streptosporangiaceae bacterium]|nr:NUDIX hydrolase [Streptosporangiaceae bacterium]
MPDRQEAEEIRAAGAVLWRPARSGTQVALIHRPKYDDWSLAKGKVDPGEHVVLAAVREVQEETGLRVTLGLHLPLVRYLVGGQPKRVDYWAAQPDAPAGELVANKEVDRLEWVALSRARGRLSYEHDAALLDAFRSAPRPTAPLILLRHAEAGSKADWRRDDASRPLDAQGKQQATVLGRLLSCFGRAGRVLSSPTERCLATVRPFAALTGAKVEPEPALAVAGESAESGAGPAAERDRCDAARQVAASAAAGSGPVVICAHRENLPLLLTAACAQLGAKEPAGP